MAGRGGVPTRFGGVGASHVHRNSAICLRSRDRGCDDAVVFAEIDGVNCAELLGDTGLQSRPQ